MTISIYDHTTGETIERELTEEELAQIKADETAHKKQLKAEADLEAARASATAKLAELGLTEAEIAVL
jgi:hypothetical protein